MSRCRRKPQFQYIGMIARKRYNNDTAYFLEQGKQTPMAARLNDVVGGRFRLVSVAADETILEDVNLGFRHKLQLYRPARELRKPAYPAGAVFRAARPMCPSTRISMPRRRSKFREFRTIFRVTSRPTTPTRPSRPNGCQRRMTMTTTTATISPNQNRRV